MGPILYARGIDRDRWCLAALALYPSHVPPESLTPSCGDSVMPCLLGERRGRRLWRYDFALPLAPTAATAGYSLHGRHWPVALPAAPRPSVALNGAKFAVVVPNLVTLLGSVGGAMSPVAGLPLATAIVLAPFASWQFRQNRSRF